MSEEKWYHGRLSRQKAEDLVSKAGIDGSFVVRASESIMGAYALSVLFNGSIHTYRILPTDSGLLAVQTINGVQQRKFTAITELIRAYRNPQNGLVCGLTNPVGSASDKPTLAPPPAVATPMPRGEAGGWFPQTPDLARPAMPPPSFPPPQPQGVNTMPPRFSGSPQPGSPMPPRAGIKVMLDDVKLQQQRDRELPPVPPPREAPQRPPVLKATPSLPIAPAPPATIGGGGGGKLSVAQEIREKLQDRVKIIASTCPTVGISFFEQLQQYCADGAKRDIDGVLNGSRTCAEMQELLAKEAGQFQNELEIFLVKLNVMRQLFDIQSTVRPLSSNYDIRDDDRDVDLESFLTRLGDVKNAVKNLDKRISITIKEQAGMEVESMYGTALRTSSSSSTRSSQSIPEYNFEVKTEGGLKQTRAKLQVNVDLGRLIILKGDDITQFNYDQVLQIVKNNKSRTKLSVVFDGGKKREYAFESSSQREAFCQVMQLVRNTHSGSTEPDFVSLFVGAWNMGDAMPPVDIRSWFRCVGSGRVLDSRVCNIPHDIYVIGTQETGLPEKEWLHKVTETIAEITGETLHVVAMDALWHIKIIILVKAIHKNRISHVQTSSVKTGIANTLGNKGAVAIAFQFGGTSLCFINAHLTSGNEKCGRRNQNYHDIMRSLNLGLDRCSVFDLTNRFDHLFFFGDLNYRLEMDVQEILSHIKKRDLGMLYKVDQLRREKELNKVFYGYSEEEILFPPTYRYERGTRETYSHLKIKRTGIRINVPSWCDRVLWKSYPETHNQCMAYGCSDDILTSDHSPVFCNFQIGVRGQYVSNKGIKSTGTAGQQPATINFDNIEAILKAPGKTSFYLQFHSPCLASSVRTVSNSKYDTADLGQNCIRINWANLPQLLPIISDREYLVDQHLLVLIKGDDDNDTHAEFVIALRSMIGTAPQKFQEHLTRKGEDAGQIRGTMHVKTRDNTLSRKEKTYEFIQFGIRDEGAGAVEPVFYGDSNDTAVSAPPMRDSSRGSMFGTVGPTIANAMSKVTAKISGNLTGKSTSKPPSQQQQTWSRPTVDTRPPMAAPASQATPSPPAHAGIQPVLYTEMPIRSAPSGASSPQKSHQMSPVFPTRPMPTPAPRVSSDPLGPDIPMISGSPSRNRDSSPSSSNLDDVIAEFEATGSMFEMMSLGDDDERMPQDSLSWQQGLPRPNYEYSGRSVDPRRPVPPSGGVAGPPPSYAAPSRYTSSSPTQTRTVIGQSAPPPMQSRAVIGQSAGPILPPPPGPAPQLPARRKSVRVPGSSTPLMSVPELMSRLGFSQYTEALLDNGWDSLEFLSDLTEEDLDDCGVVNGTHRHAILDCILNMEWME